jgi:hypothetical protein
MFLNQLAGKRNRPAGEPVCGELVGWLGGVSGRREGVFDLLFGLDFFTMAVRATGAAGLGTGAESFLDDRLDGAGAATAFGAATEAAVDLLGVARKVRGCTHGIADVMVAEDVAGADNHETGGPLVMLPDLSILNGRTRCKRKSPAF